MKGKETKGYRGRFSYDLVFELLEFNKQYSFPFDVIIGSKKVDTKDEIRSAINIAPAFVNFKPGESASLPEISLMTGKTNSY